MGTKFITTKNSRSKNQKLKTKYCEFPNCKKEFLGRGKTKYCEEHRKQKYKKILYQQPVGDGIGESNIVILYKSVKTMTAIRTCGLDGCNCEYEITLIPNQTIYTNYCSAHRNKFKRDHFINKQKEIDEL